MDELPEEKESSKLWKKMKRDPVVPIGIAGLLGIVGYSFYNLKRRKQSLSLYLIHTRVIAQGTLVSCLTLGLVYTIIRDNMHKIFPKKKTEN